MNKYNNGKVYMIVSLFSDYVYIGSTTKDLNKRLKAHEYNYKSYLLDDKQKFMTSFLILEHGNYDILLIENVRAEKKDELLFREKFHIQNTPNIINKAIPKTTKEERKNYQKNYTKTYREEKKEELKIKNKEYNENNKEKRREKGKLKYICECGTELRKSDKLRHERTIKHNNYLNQQE